MPKPIVGRRRIIISVTTTVAVLAAATSAWALTDSSGTAYRLATVSRGSVEQTLTTTGAISPVRASNLTFQVAGTVGRVRVSVGGHVHAGQALARLDRSSLRAAVDTARSTLNKARAGLVSDETTQTSTATAGSDNSSRQSASPTPTVSPTTGSNPHGSGTTTGSSTTITHDQQAVVAAQQQADQDLTTARAALKAARTACATELNGSTGDTSTSGSTSDDTTGCDNATSTLLTDQTTVSADQRAVANAEATLARDLGSATAARTTTARTTSASTSQRSADAKVTQASSSQRSSSSSAGATTPTSSGSVSASQLASDQATIDADRATLATANADLSQAVLHSPISGRVAAVTISKGDAVSTGSSSSSPAIRIVGSRQSKVTVELSAAQVRTVATGLRARVTPDGSAATVTGTVSSIALAPTTSSTGDSTYPVQIRLSRHATSLVSGADAAVTIRLATARDVMTVPTSAVHRSGTTAYVEEVTGGKPVHRTVKVGAVGAGLTEIRSGLTDGQRVVLADLDAAVPSSSTNLTSGSGLSSRFGDRMQFVGGGSGPVVAPAGGSAQLGP
jgi:HlyD family secretion protein